MDKISKALKRFFPKEKRELENILRKIKLDQFDGLDVKKLKGQDNIFRVRKGGLRIVYLNNNGNIKILAIERRSNNTYKNL